MHLRCSQSNACWEHSGAVICATFLHLQGSIGAKKLTHYLQSFSLCVSRSHCDFLPTCVFFLRYTRSSLIFFWQIYPPVFSLVIKSCQAEVGLHSIIPRSSHIWCSPEESRHNTHHLLSAKYVGEFCRIFSQSHSVPFRNYHIIKEAHLLCMVCCLGARSNSLL